MPKSLTRHRPYLLLAILLFSQTGISGPLSLGDLCGTALEYVYRLFSGKGEPTKPSFASTEKLSPKIATPSKKIPDVGDEMWGSRLEKVGRQLAGSFYGTEDFAMQGRGLEGRDFRGMVVPLRMVDEILEKGIPSPEHDDQIYFTHSPTEALGYAFDRGRQLRNVVKPPEEAQVFIVIQAELPSGETSPHPNGDSTYYVTKPVEANRVSNIYVFDPKSMNSDSVPAFQVRSNKNFKE